MNRSTLVWGVKRSELTEINVAIWLLQVIWVLHHIQTNYTTVCVCVLCDHDFIRIWFMLRENKTRGGKLHAVLTTAQLTVQIFWTNDVRAVGQPSPHTAPFTFDPFKRSHVKASRWSDKCVDVNLLLSVLAVTQSKALTEHQLAFHTSPTMAPEDPADVITQLLPHKISKERFTSITRYSEVYITGILSPWTLSPSGNVSVKKLVAADSWITATSRGLAHKEQKCSCMKRTWRPFMICDLVSRYETSCVEQQVLAM